VVSPIEPRALIIDSMADLQARFQPGIARRRAAGRGGDPLTPSRG
jgi:hypothetical protein